MGPLGYAAIAAVVAGGAYMLLRHKK